MTFSASGSWYDCVTDSPVRSRYETQVKVILLRRPITLTTVSFPMFSSSFWKLTTKWCRVLGQHIATEWKWFHVGHWTYHAIGYVCVCVCVWTSPYGEDEPWLGTPAPESGEEILLNCSDCLLEHLGMLYLYYIINAYERRKGQYYDIQSHWSPNI